MTHLTIQLEFNLELNVLGFHDSIKLLELAVSTGQALNSLRIYNRILESLLKCRDDETISHSQYMALMTLLHTFHDGMFALNEVY